MHYGNIDLEKNSGAVVTNFQNKALQIVSNSSSKNYYFKQKSVSGNNIASMLYVTKREGTGELGEKLGTIKLTLSCDSGFTKVIEQDAVLFYNKNNRTIQQENYINNDFNIEKWEQADDGTPDVCLACFYDNEYYAEEDTTGEYSSTSGGFYVCFRNLPQGTNRVTVDFQLQQVHTEPLRIDLTCGLDTTETKFSKETDLNEPIYDVNGVEIIHDLFYYPFA